MLLTTTLQCCYIDLNHNKSALSPLDWFILNNVTEYDCQNGSHFILMMVLLLLLMQLIIFIDFFLNTINYGTLTDYRTHMTIENGQSDLMIMIALRSVHSPATKCE